MGARIPSLPRVVHAFSKAPQPLWGALLICTGNSVGRVGYHEDRLDDQAHAFLALLGCRFLPEPSPEPRYSRMRRPAYHPRRRRTASRIRIPACGTNPSPPTAPAPTGTGPADAGGDRMGPASSLGWRSVRAVPRRRGEGEHADHARCCQIVVSIRGDHTGQFCEAGMVAFIARSRSIHVYLISRPYTGI